MTEKLSVWKGTWSLIRYRPGFFALSVTMAVYVLTTRGVVGWLQKLFFDKLTNEAPVQFDFWTLLALIVAVEVSRMGIDVIGHLSSAKVRLAGQSLLRKNVVQNILHKPGAVPLPVSSGDAVNRINHDLADYGDFPTWIPVLVGHLSFAIFALIVMLSISVPITLVAVIPLIGVFFLNRFAWERFLRYNRESRESDSAVTSFLGEIFGSIQAVKAADAERSVMSFLQTLSHQRRVANVRHGTFWALFRSASDNIGDIAVALMVVMSGVALRDGTFTVGDFSLFSTYLFFAARFPADLGSYLSEIAQQRVVLDRTQEMLPTAAPDSLIVHGPIYENGNLPLLKRPFLTPTDQIQTLQVSGLTQHFKTSGAESPSEASGIFDITFSIPRGSFTVITGRIGSGKTTLLRVLLGLLPADAGEIT
ncbi:MAG: ABC transporter ATP-binding protein, partial [Chloroflexi bacterium]